MKKIIAVVVSALALLLTAPPTASAETFGWRWNEVIDVYDGTNGVGNWKVAEAVAEWDAHSGATFRLTNDLAAANIVVREGSPSDCGTAQAIAGCAYYPPRDANGFAYGVSNVYLMYYSRDEGVAEHIALHEIGHALGLAHASTTRSVMDDAVSRYDYLTRPTSYDYRDMKSLYGR